MKEKSKTVILICTMLLTLIVFGVFIYTLVGYISSKNDLSSVLDQKENSSISTNVTSSRNNDITQVDEDSSIRIITEYDENMFKGHKSLLFFWASWCSHCQEEYDVVKTAISDYQNRGYTIYVISHDYEEKELAEFMRNNDFNYEIYFDEQRIIRKNIDPEASSVPLTYILDENGKLIDSHDGPISLEDLNNLMNRNS